MVRKTISKRKSKKRNYSRKKRGGAAAPAAPAPEAYPFPQILAFLDRGNHAGAVTIEIERHLQAINRIIQNRKNIELVFLGGHRFKLQSLLDFDFTDDKLLNLTNYEFIYQKLNEHNYLGYFDPSVPNTTDPDYIVVLQDLRTGQFIGRDTAFDDNITSILIMNHPRASNFPGVEEIDGELFFNANETAYQNQNRI